MKGQVFTVAKLHYINGVVYFTAKKGITTLSELAEHSVETTKSGHVKHPVTRVRTLVRLAEGLGLLHRSKKEPIHITSLGYKYYEASATDTWTITDKQAQILRNHILNDPSSTPTIHAIVSLLDLVEQNLNGMELSTAYAIAIEKENAWNSEVTYEGFTKFGLSYLEELGFMNGETGNLTSCDFRTFLFTWNPKKWEWNDLSQAVYEVNIEGRHINDWTCGATRNIGPGDRVFLMRLGIAPKGIIGAGVVASAPFTGLHYDPAKAQKGDKVHRVKIVFDTLCETPIIDEETLTSGVLADHKWFPQASGTRIPKDIAGYLEDIWADQTKSTYSPPTCIDITRLLTEGTKRSRLITTYERNSKARDECIKHHGRRCKVCGILFAEKYGEDIGKKFTHVHHLTPISEIKGEYKIDPKNDLCPVCPNCHMMLHQKTPPFTIEALKKKMKSLSA